MIDWRVGVERQQKKNEWSDSRSHRAPGEKRERGLRRKRDGLKELSESSLMFPFLDWPSKEKAQKQGIPIA